MCTLFAHGHGSGALSERCRERETNVARPRMHDACNGFGRQSIREWEDECAPVEHWLALRSKVWSETSGDDMVTSRRI